MEFMGKYFPQFPPDARHFDEMFTDMHKNHVLLVAEEEGEVVGMLAAFYQRHPFNPAISVLMELAWYVYPDKRHTGAGQGLLKTYSALKNTDVSTLSLVDGSFKLEPLFKAEGFHLYEKSYIRFNGE